MEVYKQPSITFGYVGHNLKDLGLCNTVVTVIILIWPISQQICSFTNEAAEETRY
jgi:hypothetical protein